MIVTAEIESIFSDTDRISKLEITYQNGGIVLGNPHKVKHNPLRVVIQKSNPAKGDRPRHKVVFDHVTRLQVTFKDGAVQSFT